MIPDAGKENSELADRVQALILSCSTITLATCSGASAWAAPVYYFYQRSGFYFFSSPESRHVTDAVATGEAAGSIHAAGIGWKDIRGIQMNGSIKKIVSPVEAARAISGYLKKFPFTGDFFSDSKADLDGFFGRFGVRLYCFRPRLVIYCDNSIRFGYRAEIDLPA
ncbi:MAG: hypothetical protein COZ70_15470 [Deltaproteobacteria bacterium CG_4_8_14_3_um_filter_51_11]|nr:hypothetical protein [bacterium]OIP41985.1 MAG: hypothetical protein AUK25_04680 [Desulfobacteraceae bacterium CG2_30_51_40]PIP46949.1 MAG: hypothetical protein COX16_07005 [Deltaproteobacteria bacterium CG23_combo_of_CG06-09_8_20_14_all_51_20]PIX18174.1 MAG: hypothetical protein COZ70_15470 [Deltaproteobacteria bacterium CG_4_8_14_3_um_filter_51_11]PIY21905.1 MAG: hypothetical protein COZ11_14615 [Deltaproteobacteria bacterium CG_4_10_14_3_um_filter_51_14]PJB37754.1 MAG: hypothetical prote